MVRKSGATKAVGGSSRHVSLAGRGAPAAVMQAVADPEEDLPLNKYPPGMRTERRDLPLDFGASAPRS